MARSPVEAEKESDVTPAAAETPEFDDVTLRAIAEVYKNEGNDEYRKKELSSAVDFYTQGIQVNCKDEELKAKLFSNRAAAHFHLGNYHDSLSDAKAAKSLQPSYTKPIERGASACEKLRLFQEAITWCDEGLAIDPNNKMLLQLRTRSVNEQDKLQKAAREKMRSDSDTQTVGGKDGGSIQAIQLYTLLLGRAKIMKNRAEEGTACFHLAETYETLGDFSRAIEYYKQCLDIAKELGDRAREGALCSKLGVCSKMLGCFKEALQYHRKHLAIAKDVRDRNGEGLANCNIGTTYRNLGDLDQALYYTKQHLDISKTLGDRNGEGDAYGNLANTYASLGDIKQALWYNKEALSIAKEARDRIKEGIIHANIGSAYQRLGDFKQALKYHKQLLPIAKELGRKDLEGVAYGSIGNALSSLGNLKEALDYQKRHLNIAQSVGNRADEGAAYSNIGVTYRDLGDLKQALKFHKQSLTIAKEIGNKATEGSVYGNLGTTYQLLGDFKEALDCNKQKLRIALEIGDRHAEGRAYGCLGSTYRSLGDFKQALDCSTQQLSIALERGDRPAEGSAYGNIGDIYQCLGDFKTALIYQKRRLQIAEEVGDTAAQGCAHNSIGLAYNDLGDYKQALHYYQQSLRIIKQVGHRHGEGQAYGNIGNTYQYLGDFEQAILYHTEHLSIAKEVSDRAGEGCAYGSLGNCYRNLEDFEQAIIYHKERLHIAKEVGDKEGEGVAYGNIGNTYLNLGDLEKGLEYLKNALDFAKNLGKRAAEGQACGNLGIAYLRLCDFEQAINYLKQQLTIAKEVGDRAGEGKAYHSLGRSFEALGSFSDALDWYQASVTQFNSIRRLLQSKDDWKISLRNQYQLTYTALWRILLKQNKINEALVAAEEGRAQALTDLLESQYGFQPEQSGSGEQEETGRDILGRFPSNTVFLAVDENEINTWVLVDGQDAQFQKKNVGANALERGVPSSFQTLMENAYEAIGVRAGVKCENRSLDLLKDGDCNSAAGWKSDLKESRPGVDYDSPLRTLYDAIIDSVANLFQGDELIIVPDGPLFMAPFAALLDSDSHHLCESFRIRLLPSLTILKFIADSPADYHCRSGALLVGDPKVERIGLPALPCARKEVEMIGRILKTSPLIGAEATKDEVLKRLNSVALVHIAAHGCKETGEIALTPNRASRVPKKEDFLLTMADVFGVKLRARLVVLSCCHSGRGEIKAEGVVGIARAFLGAGARAVLVALWAIDDGVTLEFMTSFYHHLVEGRSASEALNKAMKHMKESKEYSDVKNWAPFTLIGDDVTLEFGENQDELSHGD